MNNNQAVVDSIINTMDKYNLEVLTKDVLIEIRDKLGDK